MATLTKSRSRTDIPSPSRKSNLFNLDGYDGIYSNEELEILEKKGKKLLDLANGKIKARNFVQIRFIAVAKGDLEAYSVTEIAWRKYIQRKKISKSFHEMDRYYRKSFKTMTQSDQPLQPCF